MIDWFANLKMVRFHFFLWFCQISMLAVTIDAQTADAPKPLRLPVRPLQMIVVVTKDWTNVDGQLQRFEKVDRSWQPAGPPIAVVVGRSGMAWGTGLHPMPQSGPQKKEGDGRSPAGVFALHYTFGSEPASSLPGLKMPYVQCTSTLECVDDPKSSHYNQVLDRKSVPNPDWKSSENMLTPDGAYRFGIVIAHNSSPTVACDGSCVFMHIWAGPGIGTAGCTAMKLGDIETLFTWLDAQANPMLVQLPQAEYRRLQKAWHLPEMPGLAAEESPVK